MSGQAWVGRRGSQAVPRPVLLLVAPGETVLCGGVGLRLAFVICYRKSYVKFWSIF